MDKHNTPRGQHAEDQQRAAAAAGDPLGVAAGLLAEAEARYATGIFDEHLTPMVLGWVTGRRVLAALVAEQAGLAAPALCRLVRQAVHAGADLIATVHEEPGGWQVAARPEELHFGVMARARADAPDRRARLVRLVRQIVRTPDGIMLRPTGQDTDTRTRWAGNPPDPTKEA